MHRGAGLGRPDGYRLGFWVCALFYPSFRVFSSLSLPPKSLLSFRFGSRLSRGLRCYGEGSIIYSSSDLCLCCRRHCSLPTALPLSRIRPRAQHLFERDHQLELHPRNGVVAVHFDKLVVLRHHHHVLPVGQLDHLTGLEVAVSASGQREGERHG